MTNNIRTVRKRIRCRVQLYLELIESEQEKGSGVGRKILEIFLHKFLHPVGTAHSTSLMINPFEPLYAFPRCWLEW